VADDRRSGVCCRARSFDALPRPPSPTGRCWRSLQRVCLVPGRARISQWPAQVGQLPLDSRRPCFARPDARRGHRREADRLGKRLATGRCDGLA
jgi:hypothetical protein